MLILILNSGSSSAKYQLFDMPTQKCVAKGVVERIGYANSVFSHELIEKGRTLNKKVTARDHFGAVKLIINILMDSEYSAVTQKGALSAIGHRVVHGGEEFTGSTLIDEEVIQGIKKYARLAPLHNPANLAGILACRRLLPDLPQVAIFDTAFHHTMPVFAYTYGIPYEFYEKYGIRKYGFHGTSHRYVAQEAGRLLRKKSAQLKIITCHLGNGCSITAVDRGKSIDTSMGFTPLEGLVMGTRCGDIDPAAVLFLMRKEKLDFEHVDALLNKKSGLLGLSGISNDMRDIRSAANDHNQRADLAIKVFIYRIKKYIGAYTAAMNGLDAIVFTGGIGENDGYIKKEITRGISEIIKRFQVKILTIPTNEELMIARDTYKEVKRLQKR
jgi:acetate kinase